MEEREEWDLYDAQFRPLGIKGIRGEGLFPGQYHLTVHVCIFNNRRELLVQKRAYTKRSWPGLWDISVSGACKAGEMPYQAAQRETREELGLVLDLKDSPVNFIYGYEDGFDYYWIIEKDLNLNRLKLQEDEVIEVAFADREKFQDMIDRGLTIPYLNSHIFFDYRNRDGLYRR